VATQHAERALLLGEPPVPDPDLTILGPAHRDGVMPRPASLEAPGGPCTATITSTGTRPRASARERVGKHK
jgi:hypothetical protein